MPIPLSPIVYERGTGGVPSTTLPIADLGWRASSYEHSISDRFGFESCRIPFVCSSDEATDWLQNGLLRSLVVSGPDAETVWEGFLETITVRMGQKAASVSLATMGNRVRALFTNSYTGVQGSSAILSDTTSQAVYGIKDRAQTLSQTNQVVANNLAARMLASYAFPRSAEATTAATGSLGGVEIELQFTGWYKAAFDWLFASRNSSVFTDTGTQVSGYIVPTVAASNAYLSSDVSNIAASGITDTEYIAPNTYYRKKLENLLDQGNSSNQQLAWGVYEGRVFRVAVWAGATPTTITYQEDAGSGQILDTYGNVVAPWNVRPNAMSQIAQLLDSGPPSGAVDAAGRKYVGRVTCQVSSDSAGCTLEPSGVTGLDAFLATMHLSYNG